MTSLRLVHLIRLEWTSRSDCLDVLQVQSQLQPGGWTEVERFTGTVETLSKEIPRTDPVAIYRLQRELKRLELARCAGHRGAGLPFHSSRIHSGSRSSRVELPRSNLKDSCCSLQQNVL